MLRKGIIVTCLTPVLTAVTLGQVAGCPQGYVCLTQEAAQRAVENARLRPLLEEKVTALESSVAAKEADLKETRETARKNEADLRQALNETTVKYATTAGELIATKAEVTRQAVTIEFLLKNGRNKCGGLTMICIQ